jgi:hypothetical protein
MLQPGRGAGEHDQKVAALATEALETVVSPITGKGLMSSQAANVRRFAPDVSTDRQLRVEPRGSTVIPRTTFGASRPLPGVPANVP